MVCEKCWGDAYKETIFRDKSQAEAYYEIIAKREANGEICTPQEQAGDYWDEEKQIDTRKSNK